MQQARHSEEKRCRMQIKVVVFLLLVIGSSMMNGEEDGFDLLLEMVGDAKTLQLMDHPQPAACTCSLLQHQQTPHSLLEGGCCWLQQQLVAGLLVAER